MLGGLSLLSLWLLWIGIEVYRFSFLSDSESADAAIVMGAAVWRNRPSPVFRARIDHAVALYRSGQVRKLIFTGGVSTADPIADSQIAAAYAVGQGVSPADIFCERVSRTTFENLHLAKAIVREQGMERVLLVSDPPHMKRTITMARDLGLDAHPSPALTTRYRSWYTRAPFFLRETYYYATYLTFRPPRSLLRVTPHLDTMTCS